jgi:hypothetical protein
MQQTKVMKQTQEQAGDPTPAQPNEMEQSMTQMTKRNLYVAIFSYEISRRFCDCPGGQRPNKFGKKPTEATIPRGSAAV